MNAYAGRVYLSPDAQARLKITDPYSIHRVLLEMVDGSRSAEPETSSGLLWVDRGQTLYGRRIDFLSRHPVSASKVPADDVSLEVKPLPDGFLDHQEYRFQILVNPCRCVSGKRVAVTGVEKIGAWFQERAAVRGMQVSIASVDKIGRDVIVRKNQRVVCARARISGILKVTDPDLFKKAFLGGIGKCRAFGYGFLQVSVIK